MRLLFTLFILLCVSEISATHVLGGDMSARHIGPGTYEVTLRYYNNCDPYTSNLPTGESDVRMSVFDSATDTLVMNFVTNLHSFEEIPLSWNGITPDGCIGAAIYKDTILLADNQMGYYVAWDRCCRASNITNLNLDGEDIGHILYADIAPNSLENSTPAFEQIQSNTFFCTSTLNSISFAAEDIDGDSLVYALIPAESGISSVSSPDPLIAGAKPYSNIPFESPYDLNDLVGGSIPLSLNEQTGLVEATPDLQGAFNVAVRVTEFRNGVPIGVTQKEVVIFSTPCSTSSLLDNGAQNTLHLAPNPAEDYLQVLTSGSMGELAVYDNQSRKLDLTVTLGSNGKQLIDIQKIPPGVYHIIFTSEDRQISKRFVKE